MVSGRRDLAKLDKGAARPLLSAFVWVGVLLLSIPLTGFARLDPLWAIFVAATLLIAGVQLLFLHLIYRDGK